MFAAASFFLRSASIRCAAISAGRRPMSGSPLRSPKLTPLSHSIRRRFAAPAPPSMDVLKVIASQTDVSLTLTNHLIATEASSENFVYSPVSIQVVLSLIAAGSKGRALDELLSFLKSKSTDDLGTYVSHVMDFLLVDGAGNSGPKLAVANGVWVDESLKLKAKFGQVVRGEYKAAAKQVDFQTKVGGW